MQENIYDDVVDAAPPASFDESARPLRFEYAGRFEHAFSSDLDLGGKVRRSEYGVSGLVTYAADPQVDVGLSGSYTLRSYSFRGATALGAEPWDDVHRINIRGNVRFKHPDFVIFGGPIISFARETDGVWNDSFTGGGLAGASFVVNDHLRIGGGLGVISQLEDSTLVFPLILVDWRIADRWRLGNEFGSSSPGGIELIWSATDDWEIGFGGRYDFDRFRLDENGVVPSGIGEVTGAPIWVRATRRIEDRLELSVFGGVSLFSNYRLEDSDGNRIAEDDGDPTPVVGISVSARF